MVQGWGFASTKVQLVFDLGACLTALTFARTRALQVANLPWSKVKRSIWDTSEP